jgi:hypothetical protein
MPAIPRPATTKLIALLVLTEFGPISGLASAETQVRSAAGKAIRFDVSRDAWVSEVRREADGNNGGAPRLKLKSIQEMSLLDFEARPLVGRTIRTATLHVKLGGDEPLRRVTVSSVGAEWFEGTGSNYAIETGGVTFRHRRHPDLSWSLGGGDLCHVILGNGGTIWRMADASPPDSGGWQTVSVDPRVVAARVAGLSHGFLAFDDTGSEWTRTGETFKFQLYPNRFVFSREQNRESAPYFTVELGPDDRRPPHAPAGMRVEPGTANLPPGEALVSWVTPGDQGPAGTLGFHVTLDGKALPRELIPLAGPPGGRVELHLRELNLAAGKSCNLSVNAADAAGNIGSAASARIRLSDRPPTRLPQPVQSSVRRRPVIELPRIGGAEVAILDELDKVNPVSGELIPSQADHYLATNHLWDAKDRKVTLQAARNEFVAFQILLRGDFPAGSINPELVFEGTAGKAIQFELGRYHPISARQGPLPDPIVPLAFESGSAPRLKNQSLYVEVYVPHELAPGEYSGTLKLTGDVRGRAPTVNALSIPVSLRVWDFSLPDHLSFMPEMNCYGLPENEREYYRLAHRHRTVLNRLPYNQNGRMQDGCAPIWNGQRLTLDWSVWDRRFGPLLNGSAFQDLPRKGVPVECFYLPLHENWPTSMEGYYNGDYWADRAFPEAYRQAFVAASRRIAEHLQTAGWTETLFQGFLNNKNNFKFNGWSRGSSPWLLDEPASFQDYWALRYFGRAFHEGINQAAASNARASLPSQVISHSAGASDSARPRLVFRADISRPQWRRDSLDGLLDYHVVGSAMRSYPGLIFERRRTLGEIILEYGSTNPLEGSNVQPVAWCIDTWSRGGDGIIPWQTVGTADSWKKADELALFYPVTDAGSRASRAGATHVPIPSIRLKAYRRGQQDVEYLTLWSQLHAEPRWAVGASVRAALRLAGKRQGTGFAVAEDAGRIDYGKLLPQDLWALRFAIGESLSRSHPAPKTKLVDFRTPRREPDKLPGAFVGE